MSPEILQGLLQFGALGVLAGVLYYAAKFFSRIADRFIEAMDKLDTAMTKVGEGIHEFELASAQRHAEEAAQNRAMFEGIMSAVVRAQDSIVRLEASNERTHAELMKEIADKTQMTRHNINNSLSRLQLMIFAQQRGHTVLPPTPYNEDDSDSGSST